MIFVHLAGRPQHIPRPPAGAVYSASDLAFFNTRLGTLVVHGASGSWAYLDAAELALLDTLGRVPAAPGGLSRERRGRLLSALWARGLVAADGASIHDAAALESAHVAAAREVCSLEMLLAPGCNLACTYCSLGHETSPGIGKATKEEALDAIDAALDRGKRLTVVDLGEVAMIGKLWREIVVAQRARPLPAGRQLRFVVQTNGTTFDESDCAFAAALGIAVGVSLDGPRELHDRARVFRDGCGSYDCVAAVLGSLAAHRVQHWTVATIGRHNVDAPERVIQALAQFTSAPFELRPVVHAGAAAADWDTVGIDSAEYAGFLRRAIRHGLTCSPARLDLTSRRFLARILGRPDGWSNGCPSRWCGCGETRVAYEAGGWWLPCPRFARHRLREAERGRVPALELPASDRGLPAGCTVCPWRVACGGGCALAGDHDANCPGHRAHFQALFEDVFPAAVADPAVGRAAFGAFEVERLAF